MGGTGREGTGTGGPFHPLPPPRPFPLPSRVRLIGASRSLHSNAAFLGPTAPPTCTPQSCRNASEPQGPGFLCVRRISGRLAGPFPRAPGVRGPVSWSRGAHGARLAGRRHVARPARRRRHSLEGAPPFPRHFPARFSLGPTFRPGFFLDGRRKERRICHCGVFET